MPLRHNDKAFSAAQANLAPPPPINEAAPRPSVSNTVHTMDSATPGTIVQPEQNGKGWADVDGLERADNAHPRTQRARAFINQLPTWKEFLANEWKDLVVMAFTTIITQFVIPPIIGNRKFPVPLIPGSATSGNPRIDTSALLFNAYEYREQIVPVWLSAFLAIFPSIIIISLFQIRLKSYPDFHAAIMGALTTLITGTIFQIALKAFIGGLRPYFYDACQIDFSKVVDSDGNMLGTGLGGVMFDRSICTAEWQRVKKGITGWPSGHSNAAAGSALFLSLYLNGKLKCFADSRARFWKLLVFFLPLVFGATLCGSLGLDQTHTWYDIITGILIGLLCAVASYRMRYAALWDFRFNHIPLPKSSYKMRKTVVDAEDMTYHPENVNASSTAKGNKKLRSRGKLGRTFRRGKYVVHPQRFNYDLATLAAMESNPLQALNRSPYAPFPDHFASGNSGAEGVRITDSRVPHPLFPVMTRHWMGSAVGAPGDAWKAGRPEGAVGIAHSGWEYGRYAEGQSGHSHSHGPISHTGKSGMGFERVDGSPIHPQWDDHSAHRTMEEEEDVTAQRLRGGLLHPPTSRFDERAGAVSMDGSRQHPKGLSAESTRRAHEDMAATRNDPAHASSADGAGGIKSVLGKFRIGRAGANDTRK